MWTTNFKSAYGKETIGDLIATWNKDADDEFVYVNSVNLDVEYTIDDFIEKAKSALIEFNEKKVAEQPTYVGKLEEITSNLNK